MLCRNDMPRMMIMKTMSMMIQRSAVQPNLSPSWSGINGIPARDSSRSTSHVHTPENWSQINAHIYPAQIGHQVSHTHIYPAQINTCAHCTPWKLVTLACIFPEQINTWAPFYRNSKKIILHTTCIWGLLQTIKVKKIAHYWRYPSILSVGLLVGWMEVGSSTLCSDLQLDWDSGLTGGEVEW